MNAIELTPRNASEKQARLLVFIVAYHAETTIRRVLDRIPAEVFTNFDCEILVIDDGSTDRTYEVGIAFRRENPGLRATILRNEFNQGYGGNQKIGYAYALQEGFDFVALVHGDGQYPPEELPRLLKPLLEGQADAVFGSRMMSSQSALKGGMPLYKFVGNRILTFVENALLGTHLSEFHSGYRIYSVAALRALPFQLNTNDFHFDTEIIIQLVNAGLRIVELPIPTYYGDEICRVNGMSYAYNVVLSVIRNALHRAGLLYQRRFDTDSVPGSQYRLKLGYASSHSFALDAVPSGANVLDLGGGPGGPAVHLLEKGCQVTLVDCVTPSTPPKGVQVFIHDLDEPLSMDISAYDHILLLDVIEHVKDPEDFLFRLRARFDNRPKVLVLSTPNVAFIVQRFMLLLGQFNYGKAGILDRTHKRLFTLRAIRHLLRDAGFRIKVIRGIPAPFPIVLGTGLMSRILLGLNQLLIRLSRTLFSYQFFVVADCTPSVEFLLHDARSRDGAANDTEASR